MKTITLRSLVLACVLTVPALAQQKTFNWVPGNDEIVSLDPGYFHAGPTYQLGPKTREVHVDIDAQQPVTIAMVSAQEWSDAPQHPEAMKNVRYMCAQEHVVKASYACVLPPAMAVVIVVHDERIPERGGFFGIGEVITRHDRENHDRENHDRENHDRENRAREDRDDDRDRAFSAGVEAVVRGRRMREFISPNDVHIRYFDWSCTDNCNLPDPPRPKLFNWVPTDSETVRLDPANYYTARTFNPGSQGGNVHIDIEAQHPITLAIVDPKDWTDATEHPNAAKNVNTIDYLCVQQHALRTSYACTLPGFWPKELIIRDERTFGHDDREGDHSQGNNREMHGVAGSARVIPATAPGAVVSGRDSGRQFSFPNDIRIQYYSWRCVESCDQPDFGWVRQIKEKYELTKILKVYGGITPDHDGAQVSIKVKSPVPMAVAILPARVAGQMYGNPEMFESAVAASSCQQRGVQSSTFQCAFNLADGPQSLVLLPEAGANIPNHKKAEIEVQAVKCVDNCAALPAK